MKRFLSILMIIVLLLTFVSCDGTPDKSDSDDGQNSSQSDDQGGGSQADDQGQGEGGGQTEPVPKATYTVTFIQEDADPIIETYEEGDPLWLHAPKLRRHNMADFYYYNWDKELDVEVTSNMTVTRTENEGHAAFFMNVDEQTIKIIGRAEWTTLPVADFPALPEIEGFIGVWDQEGDIGYFSSARTDILCWYHSTETYSTGLPTSFIIPNPQGRIAFTISEYPINLEDTTLKYVKKSNYVSAGDGLMSVTSDEAASVIGVTQGEMADIYAAYSFKEQSDYLIENVPGVSFVNAIKVMRQETGDNGWSVPQASNLKYVFLALAEQEKGDTFYGYLSDGLENVRSINGELFFLDSGSNRRMRYSSLEAYGPISAEYSFGITFNGYLWPIKPITVE